MEITSHWSRLERFFNLGTEKRRKVLASLPITVDENDFSAVDQGLSLETADRMSENVIATFSLPFSVAVNFVVDGEPVVIPMVTEEPSIVAACSKMAKLVAQNGGFSTTIAPALIKGQIQLYQLRDIDAALLGFHERKSEILAIAQSLCPRMNERGGGVRDIGARILSSKIGPMLVIEPVMDVVDAMGANAINTLLEHLAIRIAPMFDGVIGLRILSNLCDQRVAHAQCSIPFSLLANDAAHDNGYEIAHKMLAAHAFAEADRYRACTHNKGVLNGIDAVAIATGNDFRAIEAGAHAYASRDGSYQPLTTLDIDEKKQMLFATISMPLAIGVVGGIFSLHEGVGLAHKILGPFAKTSKKLSAVMISVGLSQCLGALLALCQDGIQKGHMKLHKKKLVCLGESSSQD